ncbi:MXAN_6577-like cysteine-rich protein [Pyxidicoccus trucidator]|uniref:MXAN_6577-like cysteine-rich protein n=1 Tax=Pyxidicoccus trucidator TaxID=2709662 RepID=UPI0013DCCC4C|nr:MXAN_6577-like cysteine-rich protein [Pyxidicoccus trucidator]
MPREFAITSPTPTLSLESDGRGEIAFTVSNVTDRAMHAGARLLPAPPLKPEWLSIRGKELRDMPPGATEVFTVDVHVPPGTPPGPYTFQLVVADVDLPDERFAEGPTIAVEARAAPLPAKPFPWWWLVVGGLVIVGGALALFFGLRGDGPVPETCPAGQLACEDRCVDVQADPKHCGACGNACGEDQDCSAGQCVRGACPEGKTRCGDVCLDTAKDDRNCGACGATCGAGLFCRDGRCQCPSNLTLCGGRCVDTNKDVQSCGGCNTRCGANQVCEDGRCICTGSLTLCGGRCVETDTDEQNCRTCGVRCGPTQQCLDGTCKCGTGLTLCGGSCVNMQTDERNCGRCGTSCATGRVCKSGACVTSLPAPCGLGQILCPCTGTCISNAMCSKLCASGVQPK